jgi:pyrimidine-nucleoside phosphorylase
MSYTAVELIGIKRDGGKLSDNQIKWLISAYTNGTVLDYQMSSMAMAILLNGLDGDELSAWTAAMLHSGDVMDFSDIAAPKVDKHSTGGVGDKISIPLAPLVAACGVAVPMMSGRGLGHTGGTLDKLESIEGFTTGLSPEQFRSILTQHGIVLAGQSETMVPADRKLYALRDASGTVPSIPLISSSIMSKKMSEGLNGLILDVKTGSGAFMKTTEDARELARTMVDIGKRYDVNTVALITSMEEPLGNEIGNANEIKESIDVLKGDGPDDVTELTLAFGEVMLELGSIEGGRELLLEAIGSGAAFEKFVEVTIAHGGNPAVLEDPNLLPAADHEAVLSASRSGFVTGCDALAIGMGATLLGAGRTRKEDVVDPGVGITLHAKTGIQVEEGDPLATVRYQDESRWQSQKDSLGSAWTISDEPLPETPLILQRID